MKRSGERARSRLLNALRLCLDDCSLTYAPNGLCKNPGHIAARELLWENGWNLNRVPLDVVPGDEADTSL